jgi:hypothetical protein
MAPNPRTNSPKRHRWGTPGIFTTTQQAVAVPTLLSLGHTPRLLHCVEGQMADYHQVLASANVTYPRDAERTRN